MSGKLDALEELIKAVEAGEFCMSKFPPGLAEWFTSICHSYHGSLDAAKALHDALLPGWRMDALWQGGVLSRTQDVWHCRIRCIIDGRTAIDTYERVGYDTPARAWLLAILRAHRTQIGGAA